MEITLLDQSQLSRTGSCRLFDSGKLSCGMFMFSSKSPTEPHAHPNSEVVEYVIQGKGCIWVNTKPHVMERGTVIYIPTDAWHSYQCLGDEPFVFLGSVASERTFRTPLRQEVEQGRPGLDATVVTISEGRAVKQVGKTSTMLIEPKRVGAKTIGLGVAYYDMEGISGTLHSHNNLEQVIYVQSGHGVCVVDGDEAVVGPGSAVYIPPGAKHQLRNSGSESLQFVFIFFPLGEEQSIEYPPEL